ncbi:MAG: hypothetical protein NTW87_10645 [Planctomycetota bacterium]|nr:hypothetical protein [Planctomycetota bacterium]
MTYKGKVTNGVVVLEDPRALQEGTEVRVVAAQRPRKRKLSLSDKLLQWAGRAKGLPCDLAENHDHYVHGRPKR